MLILFYKDEIFGSAYVAAVYLSTVLKFPKDKKVFVIGMSGIEEELREEGITFIGGTVRSSINKRQLTDIKTNSEPLIELGPYIQHFRLLTYVLYA